MTQTNNADETFHIDPICAMKVADSSKLKTNFQGKEYFFCSNHCLKEFSSQPEKFLIQNHETTNSKDKNDAKSYFPLFLLFSYLIGVVCLNEVRQSPFNAMRLMTNFMGIFFLAFSFFKFLNLKGFAEAYRSYDIVAKRFPIYGYIYPFIELVLGVMYFVYGNLFATNFVTAVVMLVSSLGVAQSLFRKSAFQCACLGTIFQLPMSKITLFEDILMLGMAILGLVGK